MIIHSKNKTEGIQKIVKRGKWQRLMDATAKIRRHTYSILAFILFVTAISLMLSYHLEYLPANIQVGKVSPKDLKADRNYEIIDTQATDANRQKVFSNILPVFDYDDTVLEEIDQKIKNTFKASREFAADHKNPEEYQAFLQTNLGISLSPDQVKLLVKGDFAPSIEAFIRTIVQKSMLHKIVAGRGVLPSDELSGITLREIQKKPPNNEMIFNELKEIHSLDEIQKMLPEMAMNLPISLSKEVDRSQLIEVAKLLILPNVTYNSVETDKRRAKAVANVPNVIIKVQVGESIIRAGDRYEPYHLLILEGIRKQKSETRYFVRLVGTVLFVSLLLLITVTFAKRYIRKFNPTQTDYYFLGASLILLLAIVRFAVASSLAFQEILPYNVPVQALYYAIPIAGGAMLARYLLNSEIALVFAIVSSALTGMFLQESSDLAVYYLISGIVAASAVAHVDHRSAMLRAGLVTGIANALVVLAIKLITVVSVTQVFNIPEVMISMIFGFIGGLLAAVFVMVMAPICELVFNYVTDIKLLELGNLNHPLLKEMIVKAPGTYHHSQLVAVLAEAAAAEIGANPLLARVGSYFHDIGKMTKPSYFIENQQGGENRHDRLSPSMSALIIASHVKDGMELAREYKLPSRIADFIPQHQGTKLITYFYNKALENQGDHEGEVDEKLYRYPGPKPQSREAGIILLADGVEAGVRSLKEKSPIKIQSKVQQIINKNFAEAQLDECEMTLKNLHIIAQTFTRVLIGIYHQRIEYPDVEDHRSKVTPIRDATKKK